MSRGSRFPSESNQQPIPAEATGRIRGARPGWARWPAVSIWILNALALSACHPWYLVESTYDFATHEDKPPAVVRSAGYHKLAGRTLTVALSAPDQCADRSSAEATGHARSTGRLLQTTCGVEMAELERELVKAGYRVISWSALRQVVSVKKQVTALEAAQRLKADVLFQVNSLERSVLKPGQQQKWRRTFYESDPTGTKGPVAHVSEERAVALERGVVSQEPVIPAERVSVTVDLTAVLVDSGETIWFYKGTHSERPDASLTISHLFECNRRHLSYCILREPRRMQAAGGGDTTMDTRRSGGESLRVDPPEPADQVAAQYYGLVGRAVSDLVREFASHL